MLASDLLQGIVVETKTTSLMGDFLYSDKYHPECESNRPIHIGTFGHLLNTLSSKPIIGIAVGVTRMALAAIHTVSQLFSTVVTWDKGHLVHAAKGSCEFLRGLIESIPIAGRLFANHYVKHGEWWIIKIYNPDAPDSLDNFAGRWKSFKKDRTTGYVRA